MRTATTLFLKLFARKIRRRHHAAVDDQGMTIDEICIVADQKQSGFRLIFRCAEASGKILKCPAAGDVIIKAHR